MDNSSFTPELPPEQQPGIYGFLNEPDEPRETEGPEQTKMQKLSEFKIFRFQGENGEESLVNLRFDSNHYKHALDDENHRKSEVQQNLTQEMILQVPEKLHRREEFEFEQQQHLLQICLPTFEKGTIENVLSIDAEAYQPPETTPLVQQKGTSLVQTKNCKLEKLA